MMKRPHPAKFHDLILQTAANILEDEGINGSELLLDPFGGTGKVFQLLDRFPFLGITALEIEPEWAAWDERITVGNALDNGFPDNHFDVIFTSPTYGNRMADHHNAKDGSRRNTYTHQIGRTLHRDNSGTLQWGEEYRIFHMAAWLETIRVLKPGGLFLLNIKDHVRGGVVQKVGNWHVATLESYGLECTGEAKIPAPGNRQGQNGNARVDHEMIYTLLKGR